MDERPRGRASAIVASGVISAAVAIIVSVLIVDSHTQNSPNETANEIAALTARVVDVQRKLDTTGDQLADLQTKVAQTTDLTLASLGPDARIARLAGLAASASATGTVALSHSQGAAMLEVSGLPPTPDDKEYEVWWISEKQGPLRAGMFVPASHGSTIVSLDLPPAGEVVFATEVTLEPQAGVDKPSGTMYLKGDFSRH